ncbi:MAG: hypothetical protein JW991_01910 [Candidatus Pacebacteria bacterium]|nr:hypothetical protein [Candidatus Paceibacterota bacterium]
MERVERRRSPETDEFYWIGIGKNPPYDERACQEKPELWVREEREISLAEVLRVVFAADEAACLSETLLETVSQGGQIKMGGRQVRNEMFGCKTNNIQVIGELNSLFVHDRLRLGPLVRFLRKYPVEKSRPDIDFFTSGVDLRQLGYQLEMAGLEIEPCQVSGGAELVAVKSKKGMATFIDAADSWQTQGELWPMYGGVFASLDPNGKMTAAASPARWRLYPTAIPKIESYPPDHPQRMAAAFRALLWLEYSTDDQGHPLMLPPGNQFIGFFQTVGAVRWVLNEIEGGRYNPQEYKTAFRDLSLALLSMTGRSWGGFSTEGRYFFGQMQVILAADPEVDPKENWSRESTELDRTLNLWAIEAERKQEIEELKRVLAERRLSQETARI